MDRQMTIFDFPEYLPDEKSLEEMTIEEAAQIINERCGLSLKPSSIIFNDGTQLYKCKKKKFKFGLSFGRFLGGKYIGQRFLSVDIDSDFGRFCGVGYCDLSMQEAINHINKVLETGEI